MVETTPTKTKTTTKTTKAITSVARYAKERYWEDSSTTGVGRTLVCRIRRIITFNIKSKN
jgi:hypothetical protein